MHAHFPLFLNFIPSFHDVQKGCSFDGPAANDVIKSSVEIVFFVAQITVV
jgi:hypothetical protein